MIPKLVAAITRPEIPQTYLGGLKKIEATKLPTAVSPPRILSATLLAMKICLLNNMILKLAK